MNSSQSARPPEESGEDGRVVYIEDYMGVQELLATSPGEGLGPIHLLFSTKTPELPRFSWTGLRRRHCAEWNPCIISSTQANP